MQLLSLFNDEVKFFPAWVVPLKNLTSKMVLNAFQKLFMSDIEANKTFPGKGSKH